MKTRDAFNFLVAEVTDHPSFVRCCPGYKQLPFTIVWIGLPDVEGLLQSKGITDARYTLPAIEDLAPHLVFLILAADHLNPVSEAYYHRMRVARPGLGEYWTTLDDVCAAGPEDRAEW